MDSLIKGALIANVASLGFHWIYDASYIKTIAQKEAILFKPQNPVHYQNAKEAYLGYADLEVGALSMQGNVLKWLYDALNENPNFNQADYRALLFEKLKPGGQYVGYVESYANKMISKTILNTFNIDVSSYPKDDDHLIGLMPYFVFKAYGKKKEEAFELVKLFSENTDYLRLFEMFDHLFDALKHNHSLQEALKKSIAYAPSTLSPLLKSGIQLSDTAAFVKQYQLVACSIYEAIPIVYHLAYHAKSYEQAIYDNMLIGGNLSDRGAVLGAILSALYPVSERWIKKANLKPL